MGARVLVVGDPEWEDYESISSVLGIMHALYDGIDVLIEGDAWWPKLEADGKRLGVDQLSRWWAMLNGVPTLTFRLKWTGPGSKAIVAGFERNQRMLDEGKPDVVVAFHTELTKSKNALDLIRRADLWGGLAIWMCDGEALTRRRMLTFPAESYGDDCQGW